VTINAINVIYPDRNGIPTRAPLSTSPAPVGQILTSVGISALVATIILIALTVLGGVMIWAYFQRTAGGLMAAGEKLDAQAIPQVAGTWKLVDMKATNLHSVPVTINAINVIYPDRNGIPTRAPLSTSPAPVGQILTAPTLPATLNPNQYVGFTLRVVANATTIEILYTPTGQPQQTVLVSIG
jgi:hypothetical protein